MGFSNLISFPSDSDQSRLCSGPEWSPQRNMLTWVEIRYTKGFSIRTQSLWQHLKEILAKSVCRACIRGRNRNAEGRLHISEAHPGWDHGCVEPSASTGKSHHLWEKGCNLKIPEAKDQEISSGKNFMRRLQRRLASLVAKLIDFEPASGYLPTRQESITYIDGQQSQRGILEWLSLTDVAFNGSKRVASDTYRGRRLH